MRFLQVTLGRRYQSIKAWQKADELVVLVYRDTRLFPRNEIYGLTGQMRRAAVSAAANIVEGSARKSRQKYLQFLYTARGSLTELSYYVQLAMKLGYLSGSATEVLSSQCEEASRTLFGLIGAVSNEIGK